MEKGTKFAKWVFAGAGTYGVVVLTPLYFLEDRLARDFPPAFSHPDHFYGFLGVALAWQLAFLLIARDVARFRPLMLVGVAEKWLSGGAVLLLFAAGRVGGVSAAPAVVDLLLGGLFVLAYVRTRPRYV